MISEAIFSRMRRVFLATGYEFTLRWNGKLYELIVPNKPICHPLEISLIGQNNLTGHKIKDIQKVTKKSVKWILGFHHGLINNQKKYKNEDYLNGYNEGQYFANKEKLS